MLIAGKVPNGLEGLSEAEAAARRRVSGVNAIPAKRRTLLRTFLYQFTSPFDVLLLGVAAISIVLHQATDAAIVLAIVAASVALGTRNEYRAEQIIEKLQTRISHKATVIRSGTMQRVEVCELVPGDIVTLNVGDGVPADLQVRFSEGLECDESTLTGESRPVEKNEGSDAYMGTSVSAGRAYAVVVAIGKKTRFGEIAVRAAHASPPTAFELGLRQFAALLLYITVTVSTAVFAGSILLHRSVAESLLFSLAISVSLTPQMLPVIVSVSLSLGAYRMAKLGALVKRLISIEDIGNIQVLFTDKTGTLTSGHLTFEGALDANGCSSEETRFYGLLCNSAGAGGDPNVAVNALDLTLWENIPATLAARVQQCARISDLPFDYERRTMSVVAQVGNERRLIVKGAAEAVLARCASLPAGAATRIDALMDAGARIIAVGARPFTEDRPLRAEDESGLQYAGVLVFNDPPKEGVAQSLEKLAKLNVRVKVITGDHPRAAQELCARVGLSKSGALVGADIDALDDAQLHSRIQTTDLFARISPLQKERIIRVARQMGDVGFLGDGVNDVLALRTADVGITVDSAADVAKDASDVVLLSKDLDILARGVTEGRTIFSNTIKYILMAVSSNFGNMISTAVGAMILPFLPLLPSQVLLNNLLYDVSEMTIPADNVDPETLVRPSHWNLGLIRWFMIAFGPFSALSDFAIFVVLLRVLHADPALFRSGFFIETFLTQALMVYVLRTRRVPFYRSRPGLQLAVTTALCAAVGIALPFSPLAAMLGFTAVPPIVMASITLIVIVYVAMVETVKLFFYRFIQPVPRSGAAALPGGAEEEIKNGK